MKAQSISCTCARAFAFAALTGAIALAGCGGDNKLPGPKTATTGAGSSSPAGPVVAPRPPTPENVPNTPTASGINIDDRIRKACGITDQEAYFAFDSSNLRSSDTQVLDKVAVCFTSGPLKGRGMRLVGHADPRGPAQYNRELGLTRADSVRKYITDHGVTSDNAKATSNGSDDATGKDEVGWAKDRRVDVMLSE
jgi:peptidoglycan-associated lipoprotein